MGNHRSSPSVPESTLPAVRAADITVDKVVDNKEGHFEIHAAPEMIAQLARYYKKVADGGGADWFSINFGRSQCFVFSWPEPGYDEVKETNDKKYYTLTTKFGPTTPLSFCFQRGGYVRMGMWLHTHSHALEGVFTATWNTSNIIFRKN